MSVYVDLGKALRDRQLMLAAAESCTGGLFSSNVTRIPGSSEWFYGAYVTYTIPAKIRFLGVDPQLLDRFGAVSEPCARAMAAGGLESSDADLCVAITGLAGPGGGDPLTPVGTVYIGWARRGEPLVTIARYLFSGSRERIREDAAWQAATGLLALLE